MDRVLEVKNFQILWQICAERCELFSAGRLYPALSE